MNLKDNPFYTFINIMPIPQIKNRRLLIAAILIIEGIQSAFLVAIVVRAMLKH